MELQSRVVAVRGRTDGAARVLEVAGPAVDGDVERGHLVLSRIDRQHGLARDLPAGSPVEHEGAHAQDVAGVARADDGAGHPVPADPVAALGPEQVVGEGERVPELGWRPGRLAALVAGHLLGVHGELEPVGGGRRHGGDVINLSLGDDSKSAHPDAGEDAAVQYALAKGVSVVASAGNGGEKGDHISYPAAYPGVIAVTAVDRYGTHASFSTRRWYATVSAPGVDIAIADPDRRYYEGWGTSAAAAFASGAVALVRAAHPDLTPAQVKRLLIDTARSRPKGGRSDAKGYGTVDPAAAIEAGARIKGGDPKNVTTGYQGRYFGPGPVPPAEESHPVGLLAPLAGGLGALLLLTAVVLSRAGRNP